MMKNKTMVSGPIPETITVTKEELAAMIRNGVTAERQNTILNKRIKPCFTAAWSSRLTWFIAGFLICTMISPFAERGNPIFQLKSDSPQAIAADAPNLTDNDRQKHRTIATAYRSVSDRIKNKTITTQDETFSALTIETANILSVPIWKKTANRLETYIKTANDLDSLAEKLDKIAEKFEGEISKAEE